MRKRGRHLILILAMFSNCANAQANNLGHPFENPQCLRARTVSCVWISLRFRNSADYWGMSGGIFAEGSDRLYPFLNKLTKTVCLETYEAARKGTVTLTVVPCPGSLSNSNVPSSWCTRSRILISPSPPDFPI